MSTSEDEPVAATPNPTTETTQTQTESAPPPQEISPGRQKLKSWLNKTLRIKMTDGRVLIGEFNCTDRDANVILSMTSEYSAEDNSEERLIGLAMVPGKHIVSIEIDVLGHNELKQTEIVDDAESE